MLTYCLWLIALGISLIAPAIVLTPWLSRFID